MSVDNWNLKLKQTKEAPLSPGTSLLCKSGQTFIRTHVKNPARYVKTGTIFIITDMFICSYC